MKTIICGPRDLNDYELVCLAIKESKFEITEIVSGGAAGIDSLGENWAIDNNIPIKKFPAKWDNIKHTKAVIKINKFGKKYDANAGFLRNEKMAEYAEACIAVQKEGLDTPGTSHMIKTAQSAGLKVFIYKNIMSDDEYAYHF